jgi:YD repeat-containing protein
MWSVTEIQEGPNFICREHHFQPPPIIQVTAPYTVTAMSAAVAGNVPVSTGQSQSAGSGSPASSTALTYDASGNVASFDNFAGYRSCFAYDDTRNLPLITLEGLAGGSNGKACPASLASYTPSAADAAHPERKTTTVWHPDWVLKAQEAAPKKITTWVYNGQPDPIVGGTASCAPSTATLPDGKPIAVLCARYEQATTDTTGALGLSATVSGATRAWTYTYNQYGQVLTETTPKQSATDTLSHTTTYTYYATTSFTGASGVTMGDLQTLTNPLGQVTRYTAYDKAGRLLSSTDPNGTVTSMTYTPRGWLQSQTVTPASGAALTTTYAYWPTGLLQTVTMPDASTLNYSYDAAHRLTDVVDGTGNKVHYVLDNVGNRTSEQVSDASGNLAASVARVFDALNRVQSQTGVAH